jgi:hypothetical protein
MKNRLVTGVMCHRGEAGRREEGLFIMRMGNERLQFELDEESALDIGSCRVDGVEIAPGSAVPDDGDARILHAVGGLLFTCGPDHIRHPEPIEGETGRRYPLHG